VEVETGFVPPGFLLEAGSYIKARITYKIISYSRYTDMFAIALPYSLNLYTLFPIELFRGEYGRIARYLHRYFNGRVEDLNPLNYSIDCIYRIKLDNKGIEIIETSIDEILKHDKHMEDGFLYI